MVLFAAVYPSLSSSDAIVYSRAIGKPWQLTDVSSATHEPMRGTLFGMNAFTSTSSTTLTHVSMAAGVSSGGHLILFTLQSGAWTAQDLTTHVGGGLVKGPFVAWQRPGSGSLAPHFDTYLAGAGANGELIVVSTVGGWHATTLSRDTTDQIVDAPNARSDGCGSYLVGRNASGRLLSFQSPNPATNLSGLPWPSYLLEFLRRQ